MSIARMIWLTLAAVGILALLPFVVLGWSTPRVSRPSRAPSARSVQVAGGTIRYEEAGSGDQTVLFLHGFNQNMGAWDEVWNRLQTCPVRRLRIDVPGFGGSTFQSGDYGLARQAERIAALLDVLEHKRVTVVGTSMGASLAVSFAAAQPARVERLALLAPSGYTGSLRHEGLYGQLLTPGTFNRAATRLARTRAFGTLFPRSAALQALTTSASYGPVWDAMLPLVRAPALLAWSRSDQTAQAQTARAVQRALPNATLFWLDDETGHGIHETRPDFTATVACLLALGVAPSQVSARLPPGAMRSGEGVEPSASAE